jgi:hypothetical protein
VRFRGGGEGVKGCVWVLGEIQALNNRTQRTCLKLGAQAEVFNSWLKLPQPS